MWLRLTRGNIIREGKRHTNRRPGFANNAFLSSTLGIHKSGCAALFAHCFTLFSSSRGFHNCVKQSRMLRGASFHTSSCEMDPIYHLAGSVWLIYLGVYLGLYTLYSLWTDLHYQTARHMQVGCSVLNWHEIRP